MQVRYPYGIVIAETGFGIVARMLGDLNSAKSHFENALTCANESEERYEGIKTLYELALLLHAQHDDDKAFPMFEQVAQYLATPKHIRITARAYVPLHPAVY